MALYLVKICESSVSYCVFCYNCVYNYILCNYYFLGVELLSSFVGICAQLDLLFWFEECNREMLRDCGHFPFVKFVNSDDLEALLSFRIKRKTTSKCYISEMNSFQQNNHTCLKFSDTKPQITQSPWFHKICNQFVDFVLFHGSLTSSSPPLSSILQSWHKF